ncbi:Glutamate receptor ionotropic, kainate 4 [Amphibalanus amphitrite]|uniref:Glutamate receptor ionotropic, kainate 4 n=1 Tax=Amphibalanus amphitrite TaxID=1232801 RepID=A0A6A4WDM1_AMPAM|nr:Glutamate receptor ionotropic, kainate 4 [Amphibalanus amphitrite]
MPSINSLIPVGRNWSLEGLNSSYLDNELVVTAIHDPPYLSIRARPDGSFSYEGYLLDVWKTVAHQLGLRYRIVPLLRGGGYGSLDANGSWSGMMGELVSGRADLALTMLYMRSDRAAVVDYVDAVSVGRTSYTFLVRTGHRQAVTPDTLCSLLRPLHADVWWALIAALFLLSLAFRVLLSVTCRGAGAPTTTDRATWGSCLFSSFTIMVGQGWPTMPSALSSRTVTIFGWALYTIIYNSYAATLVSHLTVATAVSRPLHSLKEFHGARGWTFAVDPSIGAMNHWKSSDDPYEKDLYQRSVTQRNFIALNISHQSQWQVMQPNVMSYVDRHKLSFFLGSSVCELVPLLDEPVEESNNYLVMVKGRYRLRHAINQELLRLKETGLLSRLELRWINFGSKCGSSGASDFKELTAGDLLALLLLIPLAAVVSALLAAVERLWFNYCLRK